MRLRTPRDVGALIRERRRQRGLDQADLAEAVGVSRLWINQVEGGKPGASLGRVLDTLTVLGIDLFGEAPPPRDKVPDPVRGPDINAIVASAREPKTP